MKKSKFYTPPTFKQRLTNLKYAFLFWKGRSRGMIYTRDIKLNDFRYIFFPKDFYEKYGYLGSVPDYKYYDQAMVALVLAMDYEAKPKWCPRWFLRFLHVFGSDKSIVRVRNWTLHNLLRKLTKGIAFIDYKTKWSHYDLRISIHGPKYLQDLADDIEHGYYERGYKQELQDELKRLDPNAKPEWSIERLKKSIAELENR